MNYSPGIEYPQACVEAGVNCENCTSATARELARACPGLPPSKVAQLFVQIHVHSACSRMHRHFGRAYAEALTIERKRPEPQRMLAMVAAA